MTYDFGPDVTGRAIHWKRLGHTACGRAGLWANDLSLVTCKRCRKADERERVRVSAARSEAEIQAAIIAYLEHDYRVGVVWRMSVGARRGHTFGVRGQADVFALLRSSGRLLTLEVKRPGEDADPHQLEWGETVTRAGGVYAVVRSVEDARAQVEAASELGAGVPEEVRAALAWLDGAASTPPREVGRDGLALSYSELREENRAMQAKLHRAMAVALQMTARVSRAKA
jgi:hypothetical protein